jgi:hypothetical protein
MFIKNSPSKSKLDEAIEDALVQLNGLDITEPGYNKQVDNIERLMKLRKLETPERLSRDTLALVIGNLLGIVVIVGHERAHIVTSKALNFVMKSR